MRHQLAMLGPLGIAVALGGAIGGSAVSVLAQVASRGWWDEHGDAVMTAGLLLAVLVAVLVFVDNRIAKRLDDHRKDEKEDRESILSELMKPLRDDFARMGAIFDGMAASRDKAAAREKETREIYERLLARLDVADRLAARVAALEALIRPGSGEGP